MSNKLAPIALFVYNRPEHTLQTLEALTANELANESILYVFADGPKLNATNAENELIEKTRSVVKSKKWCKEVIVYAQTQNVGLANSIINGVTKVLDKEGKVIVLEDDLVTGKFFLEYMNTALAKFETDNRVKQVSGFAFDTKITKKNTAYLCTFISTWGWATWKRSWDEIDFDVKDYTVLKTDLALRKKFNLNNSCDYYHMLLSQLESKTIDSWGIRYWWNIFSRNGLVVNPDYSLINNIGFDSTATHTSKGTIAFTKNWKSDYRITKFNINLTLGEKYLKIISKYLKPKNDKFFFKRIFYKIKHSFQFKSLLISNENNL